MISTEFIHTLEKLEKDGCDKATLSVLVDIETARVQSNDEPITLPYCLPDGTMLTIELSGASLDIIWLRTDGSDPKLFGRTIGGPHSPDQLMIDYFRLTEPTYKPLRNWDPLPKVLSRDISDHQLSTQN